MSATEDQMKVDPARATTLIAALHSVSARISQAAQGREVSGDGLSCVSLVNTLHTQAKLRERRG